MTFLVLRWVRAVAESFSTFAALIRLFSSVNALVLIEDGAFTEGFLTLADS